ncbi:hypothetical protein [Ureibacillus sinduriensis]|uniref:Uncharacterized protein n=1 Tax=Ureibacillus sinduriensis BLB-1 = JCM 15800 TaxID=1384057 RepID=A0A0A3HRE2_9BACL|nr:hypothetical protein [Ureibacillus sinduriensis]KGR74974.1 hypothetical protein CD33_14695 [Ureibacillus sinduriensis BLB-1 = JCM 15800]
MSEINSQTCNLNIWYYLPDEIWDKVTNLYGSMPGWIGYKKGIPYWFGCENDDVFIMASVEPSGLSFYGKMSNDDWSSWIERFKSEATKVVGFDVGEPEDGFI